MFKPAAAAEIVRFLLDRDPSVKLQRDQGMPLLLYVCGQESECYDESTVEASIQIINAIHDAYPDSIHTTCEEGNLPIHHLCKSKKMNEKAAMKILKLLLEKSPETIRHEGDGGNLPLHFAAQVRSHSICRALIKAYPGSQRICNAYDSLPLHLACKYNNVATVEYLYGLYPDAINHSTSSGHYPIHCAVMRLKEMTDDGNATATIVQFLLDCDPSVKLQKYQGKSLLLWACGVEYYTHSYRGIEEGIQVFEAIYDAHPEAIEDNRFMSIVHRDRNVHELIDVGLIYARHGRNSREMMTPNELGQLQLHRSLQNNVRLGSIKLLVNGNPSATRSFDNNLVLPIHVACEHHNSPRVVDYLAGLCPATLRHVDTNGNTALHCACRSAKYGTIAMLLDKYDTVAVSKRSALKKLPIDLLFESCKVKDRESVKYIDSVFRLLKANPHALRKRGQPISITSSSRSQIGKKRKFVHE